MTKKVVMIVGSLRKESFNRQLAEMAAEQMKGKANVSFLEYSELPYMNQDIEFPAPDSVKHIREEIISADGLWFVTPEYNFSYPGVLKNLLDWLSRPLKPGDFASGIAVSGKKVTISGAGGKSAASGAREKLKELLTFMKVQIMPNMNMGIALDMEAFASNKLILSEKNKEELAKQVEEFLNFIAE